MLSVPFSSITEGSESLFWTAFGEIKIISVLVLSSFNCSSLSVIQAFKSDIHIVEWTEQYHAAVRCVLLCKAGRHQRNYGETASDGVRYLRGVKCRG